MGAARQDAWTEEDDLILAEVTLRHIREGSTQLAAFDEVGERIGRTPAACGFRWNSCVRKRYEEAIRLAKAQRQKLKAMRKKAGALALGAAADAAGNRGTAEDALSLEAVIRFLRRFKQDYQDMSRRFKAMEKELREKNEELEALRREKEELTRRINDVQTDYRMVNDDYRALIQIMDRARKLALLSEEEDEPKARFKMEENGNLERIE
ncbi:MAG: precorrin-3B C(17)-methyltransferase [Candidatus Reconcilbacillus cellulovorans]|uniref:Precorrin-3B C(17)-methyltransferase n=1 Tax=Candidatus Reconcilbacillus cellulovorans TaxID=1906605 RepID=A0A2A6E2C4_9BACL|nr:MAG: precorrin-3B C(17)-methyltransferase [Candidatus Reconcilbacillus cellulovorans]